MKKCPTCQRTFDDNLKFCQNDGTTLENFDPYATMVAGQPIAAAPADDDPLQIPDFDPNKTSVFSAQDQADVLSTPDPFAGLPQPAPETFTPPPPPSMSSTPDVSMPPPSFAEPEQIYQPPPSPFDSPFAEPAQQMGNMGASPDWNPPPAPVQQWGSPGVVVVKSQNKTLAIISLITGIIAIPCCWLGLLLGPAAAIMGFIAKGQIDKDPVNYTGRGLAIGGIITGLVATAIWVLYIIAVVVLNVGMRM